MDEYRCKKCGNNWATPTNLPTKVCPFCESSDTELINWVDSYQEYEMADIVGVNNINI